MLTGLFQSILTIDHTWFSDSRQSSLFEPKHAFLLHVSTKVTCTNMLLNHSNSWHLILQTCFHCETYCASLSVPPVTQYRKWKKPLQCRFWHILACVYSLQHRSDATSHSPHAGTCVLCTHKFACICMIHTRESPCKYSPRILPTTRNYHSHTRK